MLKKRIVALVAGIALVVAIAATSANVADSLVEWAGPQGQAVACPAGGSSGGGC